MTKQNKLIALIIYLLVLSVVMFVYRSNRTKKVRQLRAALAGTAAEQNKAKSAEAELTKMTRLIPAKVNTPAVIESLYRSAHESGLKQHDVVTEADKNSGTARPGGSNTADAVSRHRLKISAAGSYRSFAEYVRRVQNMEQFNRITDFKLTPETGLLKGTMTVELYSLPVKQ